MSVRVNLFVGPLVVATLAVAPGLSIAHSWSTATQLDAGGNWTFPQAPPQAGIDSAGNALAVWQHWGSPIYYSTHAPGGAWSAAQTVSTSGNLYGLQVAANGGATIAGTAGYAVFAQDRPAGGPWSPAVTLGTIPYWGEYALNVPQVILTGDANGDEAAVWEQMSGGGSPETILAARRSAGGTWGAPEVVFTQPAGLHIPLAGAAMGPAGDLLVSWETYQVVCSGKNCTHQNFTVYAAREQAGTSGWTVSGALSSPISNTYGYYVELMIDGADQAGVAYAAANDEFAVQAVRQNPSTLQWSAPVTVYSNANSLGLAGAAIGARTQGSLAVLSNETTSSPAQVLDIDGSLARNSWSAPLNLAAADPVAPNQWMAFAGNEKGGRAALWSDLDGSVRASLRGSATGTFSAPTTLLSGACAGNPGQCFNPTVSAIAVNASGQAVAVFGQPVSVGTGWSLNAATTN